MPPKESHNSPAELILPEASLPDLRKAAQECRGCGIWERATQAVLGEGGSGAEVMMVGEQPGDREDIEGHPFVGPAGKLLDRALEDAGIDRSEVYITNVVKHFNSVQRGKLRIHKKPNAREIAACRPWLDAEIARVRPKGIVHYWREEIDGVHHGEVVAQTKHAGVVASRNADQHIRRTPKVEL